MTPFAMGGDTEVAVDDACVVHMSCRLVESSKGFLFSSSDVQGPAGGVSCLSFKQGFRAPGPALAVVAVNDLDCLTAMPWLNSSCSEMSTSFPPAMLILLFKPVIAKP